MRIGELAQTLNVSPDTLRFYERSGVLPSPPRGETGYRDYGPLDAERIRLLLDLRRLDLSLDDAARLAGWCLSGHCTETTAELPQAIAAKRAEIRQRVAGLEELDRRLGALERHLTLAPLPLAGGAGACCAAAAAVVGAS
jgi:DNA-binding transcriptional MerR regulator